MKVINIVPHTFSNRSILIKKAKKYRILIITLILLVSALFYWPRRWKYIVIHHSAGSYGNIEHLQQVHRDRQPNDPIDAIAYHYIIGNGNGLEDGKVDSDFRKQYNIWGGHVRATNADKNFRGIGICIIGNLDEKDMTQAQFNSLVRLTKELMSKYGIRKENILFHGEIEGEYTKCPGAKFPRKKYLNQL
ncbi:MAG: peptidoglycan recognition family protein [Bacteroidota bacterium]